MTRWIGRFLLVTAALGMVMTGLWLAFQRPIGKALFARAVERSVADRSASLPDGLHVFVCGSGSPMPDPARAGPCLGIVAGSQAFLIDVGSGGARRLARMGFPIGRIERVYLTHLHSDHFDGLGELLLQAWVAGPRRAPLPVHGPPGVETVVDGLNQAYRIDAGYRTAHHGAAIADPAGFGGRGEGIVFSGSNLPFILLETDDLKVTVFPVDHAPVAPAYGYRIDYRDRSVVISGDTRESAALAEAASGADLMVHEALNVDMVRAMERAAASRAQPHVAKIFADIQDYHATPEAAARTAKAAGVDHLILYHIVPPLPAHLLDAAFLADAPRIFPGKLSLAVDGMLISLPAGGDAVEYRRH